MDGKPGDYDLISMMRRGIDERLPRYLAQNPQILMAHLFRSIPLTQEPSSGSSYPGVHTA